MKLFSRIRKFWGRLPPVPRDWSATLALLWVAYLLSGILLDYTGAENNSALVFVLAVTIISSITTGYLYGALASLVGGFCINYFFMFPYSAFSLGYAGYPVAMVSMVLISMIVCALTARVKLLALEAQQREQNARTLYEQNQRLSEEKSAIQLQAARESIRGNILRSVSHDLRTPLTAISGAASVLLSSGEIREEKNRSLLNDIKEDADFLITMVENILSITRIQAQSAPLKKREEMLEEVAGDAVMTIHRRFPEANVSLILPEDILYLPMDPLLIKQVMVNLLENSIRHSGDTQQIQLRLLRQEEYAVVEVRDHGQGLSPDICQAIASGQEIRPDCSGDASRGMGIGLSLCQSIIKAHDGFFTAGNHPEGGALFRFGLPQEAANA